MLKKMPVLLIFLFLLAGCGGAAPEMETAPMGADFASVESNLNSIEVTTPLDSAFPTETEDIAAETTYSTELPTASLPTTSTNYFIFSRDSSIATSDDGTELLYEYRCDTEYAGMDAEQDQFVDSILEIIRQEYASNSTNLLQYAQDSLKIEGKEYFYSYSNYQEVGVARHDRKVVSLMVLSSIYSGGAHPNLVQTAWNLDMESCSILHLEDILHEGTATLLAAMVQGKVDAKFESLGSDALFADYQRTIADAFIAETMTPYWYLNDNGLVVFFNQYELGPYAAGIIKVELPYNALEGIIREEYLPRDYTQIPGDLLLRGEWEGYRQIPITVETDGERILIGVEGEVFQVQLSEVFWLEGTAIGQKMLFSADKLEQNDVLVLTGGFDDESRSFAIEFSDGTGNTVIYYVHPGGLSEAP